MINKVIIGIIMILCLQQVQAQDSLYTSYREAVKERQDLSKSLRNAYHSGPAFQPFRFNQSATTIDIQYLSDKKELYNLQEGSGEKGFRVNTSSYLKQPFPKLTLWGSAQYENLKVTSV